MKGLNKLIESKNGNALISTLMVLAILIILGSTILLFSVNNIKMSSKVKQSTKEYYDMDRIAEAAIADVDVLLFQAESKTIDYMKSGLFGTEDYTKIGEEYRFSNAANQGFFYKRWRDKVSKPSGGDEIQYNINLEPYSEQAFPMVYKTYVCGLLKDVVDKEIELDNKKVKYSVKIVKSLDYNKTTNNSNWDSYKGTDTDIEFTVTVSNPADSTRRLTIKGNVLSPVYTSIKQTVQVGVKVNPIWTNSISAKGRLTYQGGNITVIGDSFSTATDTKSGANVTNQKLTEGIVYKDGCKGKLSANKPFASMIDQFAIKNGEGHIVTKEESGFIFMWGGTIELKNNEVLDTIIYSTSDLTIKGNGRIRGSVIVDGALNINGNITLEYNEEVIQNTLSKFNRARKFFVKGEEGDNIFFEEEKNLTNQQSKTRTSATRYKIFQWKDGRG